jgi:hypothetical protein
MKLTRAADYNVLSKACHRTSWKSRLQNQSQRNGETLASLKLEGDLDWWETVLQYCLVDNWSWSLLQRQNHGADGVGQTNTIHSPSWPRHALYGMPHQT